MTGVGFRQLGTIGQRAGLSCRHVTNDPDQCSGLGRICACGSGNGSFRCGGCANVHAAGSAGLRRSVHIIGVGLYSGHTHIFLYRRNIGSKPIHHCNCRTAVFTSCYGQSVGQEVTVFFFRNDGGNSLGQIHIAMLGNHIVLKININRHISDYDLGIIVNTGKVCFRLHIEIACNDGTIIGLLSIQPSFIEGQGNRAP